MKRLLLILLSLLALVLIAFGVYAYKTRMEAPVPVLDVGNEGTTTASSTLPADPRNATYKVEEKYVVLKDGLSETNEAVTRLVGEVVQGDVDDDGVEDAVSLLTQDGGGSGTFYYVVASLKKQGNYLGTNAVFLGDRIVPKTLKVEQGMVVVTYKIHGEKQALAEEPNTEKTMYLSVYGATLSELTVPEGATVVAGTIEKKQNAFSLTVCGEGSAHTIASSSRAYSMLGTAYTMRSQNNAPVFALLAVEKSTSTSSQKEKTTTAFSVASVMSVPKKGTCGTSSL